jgi:hypothetical protein
MVSRAMRWAVIAAVRAVLATSSAGQPIPAPMPKRESVAEPIR